MELKDKFDYIICDSPAGIESGAWHAMYFAGMQSSTTTFFIYVCHSDLLTQLTTSACL